MATVSLKNFLPYVTPKVPACPQPIVLDAVRAAAIDFCERTLLWFEKQAVVAVDSLSFPYTITPPAHGAVTRVTHVFVDGIELQPKTFDVLDISDTWDTETGSPKYYFLVFGSGLRVQPLPESSMDMRVTVAYAPTRTAEVVESFLYDIWLDAVAAGALRRLMSDIGAVWFNADGSAFYNQVYASKVHEAMIERNSGVQVVAPLQVRCVPFA